MRPPGSRVDGLVPPVGGVCAPLHGLESDALTRNSSAVGHHMGEGLRHLDGLLFQFDLLDCATFRFRQFVVRSLVRFVV